MNSVICAETQSLASCRSVADDSARLQCYDAIAVVSGATDIASADSELIVANTASTAGANSANAIHPSNTAVVKVTADDFGMENKAAQLVEKIESRISGEFKGWEAKTKFTLDNGQVWQVSDGTSAYFRATSPNISIERGSWGSFFIRIDGLNKTARVKRLK